MILYQWIVCYEDNAYLDIGKQLAVKNSPKQKNPAGSTMFQQIVVPSRRFQYQAQMAESVDALVSNTSGATRAGSTPALGTRKPLQKFSTRVSSFPPLKFGHLLVTFYSYLLR